jgi:AhpD family alkylhydroperoxidase
MTTISLPWTDPPRRIAPGRLWRDLGPVSSAFAIVAGRAAGSAPPNLFTTLGLHPRLARAWMRFAARLMPFGTLNRADTELVILRVAYNSRCAYEWRHHVRLAERAGLTSEEILRVADGANAAGWSPVQAALLQAADDVHTDKRIADSTWSVLAGHLDDKKLVELCMLIGHYEMLAIVVLSLGIQRDS